MRRYVGLLTGILVVALALSAWGELGRGRGKQVTKPADSARPVTLALEIGPGGRVTPPSAVLPLGSRVELTVTSVAAESCRIELPGYSDRVPGFVLQPGATSRCTFLADRPGEDFAVFVDGAPASRLVVAGPHLIEGHQ